MPGSSINYLSQTGSTIAWGSANFLLFEKVRTKDNFNYK